MKACDLNGDGKIDYSEFIAAACEKSLMLTSTNLQNVFNVMDLNGDGTLTKEELMQMFGGGERNEKIWDEIIATVDLNKDGKIQYEEFEMAMKRLLH